MSRFTSTEYYGDGTDPTTPVFDPGGVFLPSWLSLPQPARLRRSSDGPRTDVSDRTSYVYYPVNSAVPPRMRGHLAAVRNALGHVTRYESYDLFGNATRVVDPNGVATELTFDQLGRVLTTTIKGVTNCNTIVDPLCASDLITTRTYLAGGPLLREELPGGGTTVYGYDARGRLQTISRGASPSDLRERIEYGYDSATGKKTLERIMALEAGTWTPKREESFSYDTDGRLQEITHADNFAVHYAYDGAGRLLSTRDERHTTPNTLYTYDPAGRIRTVKQALSNASTGFITTSYAYDTQGNLTSVTDPNGNATNYSFNDFGEMLTQQSPVSGVSTYAYDAGGNLVETTDANAATTVRSYDALGRLLEAASSRSTLSTETVQWQYDNTAIGRYGIGRLTKTIDPAGVTNYFYQRSGKLRQEERTFPSDATYVTSFRYDADGNRSYVGYPSGLGVTYTYDFAGRPVSAATASASIITSATYLPFGPARSLMFGNGMSQVIQYDPRYRVTRNSLSLGSIIAQSDYSYDGAGNITSIQDGTDGGFNRDFGYDDLNRLISASSGQSLWGVGSYTYDMMGNMLTSTLGENETVFSYAGTTPKLTNETYDAAGNEISTQDVSPRNLVAFKNCVGCSTGTNYEYDSRGVRVTAVGPGRFETFPPTIYTTRHIYSPELRALGQYRFEGSSEASALSMEFVWFGDRPVAQVDWDGVKYTFADHLNAPVLQTDLAGNVIWRVEFTPYGEPYADRASGEIGLFDYEPQPLRFPGQEATLRDTYNIFRWYRPFFGRYTQPDPLMETSLQLWLTITRTETAVSTYAYSVGNPLVGSDALGLAPVKNNSRGAFWYKPENCEPSCSIVECKPGETCDVDGIYPPDCKSNPIKIVNGCSGSVNAKGN